MRITSHLPGVLCAIVALAAAVMPKHAAAVSSKDAAAVLPKHAAALPCRESVERHAYWLGPRREAAGGHWASRLVGLPTVIEPIEVYGEHSYRERLPNGWTAALLKQPLGWSFRLFAANEGSTPVDLSATTPPFRGPNSRDLYGWHFRNAANTGPNQGDVNAPQALRPFEFSQSLVGTGGFKPPRNAPAVSAADKPVNGGRGWLQVLDFGLADLAPGERARMNYLRVQGCLSWPKSAAEQSDYRSRTELGYVPEMLEVMGSCGLDLSRYQLSARVAPRYLAGDLDGDGAHDEVVQITDRQTGESDVAICRAGTWHTLASAISPDPDFRYTVSALERWQMVGKDFAERKTEAAGPVWPDAAGDVLVLERIEKSLYLVFFADGALHAQKVFRYVEPG